MPLRHVFVDSGPLREYPQFRRLWIGFVISSVGTQLQIVAVQYQVYRLSHSSFEVGLVSLVQLVPTVAGSLLGGSIADAIDRRRLLVITETAMAACAGGLALNAMTPAPALSIIFVLTGVNAAFSGCDGPTRAAVMMTIVDRRDFVAASALRQLIMQIALVLGPAIGGVLLAAIGLSAVYLVNLVTFIAAIIAVLSLEPLPPIEGGTRFGMRSIGEGMAFLRGRQAIKACFAADLNATILGMPTSLFPALGLVRFHGGATTVGLLYAAPGVGAFVGALFSGWTTRVRRQGRAVLIAIVVWGLAIAVFGLMADLLIALGFLAIAGAADVISAVFRGTIIQAETPDRLRGRLSSLQTAVVTSGPRLGNFEAGTAAALFGNEVSVVSGGIGCVIGILLLGRAMPRFSRYELDDEPPGGPGDVPLAGRGAGQPAGP